MKEIEAGAWEAVARLFGRLLLHEIDEETRDALGESELARALAEVGIEVPQPAGRDGLDELAVQFLEALVQPKTGGPPVQSLWTNGSYEGDCAVAIRRLAEVAEFEFDRAAARGAPHDHLGCILLLWASARGRVPEVAARLERDHLRWSLEALSRVAAGEGFYAGLARATASFVTEVTRTGSA